MSKGQKFERQKVENLFSNKEIIIDQSTFCHSIICSFDVLTFDLLSLNYSIHIVINALKAVPLWALWPCG